MAGLGAGNMAKDICQRRNRTSIKLESTFLRYIEGITGKEVGWLLRVRLIWGLGRKEGYKKRLS